MPILDTKAIVIRNQILAEADKIITFYTLKFGKVRAVAKGARKPKSRYSGCLELLSCGDLLFFARPNKELHSINSFDISESFFQIREDLTKIACGSYMAELVDKISQENQADTQIFGLLHLTLLAMKNAQDPELLLRAFEINLLSLCGFEPELGNCVKCGAELELMSADFSEPLESIGSGKTGRIGFSYKRGGAVCGKCAYRDSDAFDISFGTLKLMKNLKRVSPELALRFRTTEKVKQELKAALSNFTVYHLGQHLKSEKFLAMSLSER